MKKIALIAVLAPCLAYGIQPSDYTANVVNHSRGEICILSDIPKIGDFKLSKGDKKNEKDLCELDHYEKNAVCAKVWSTNPATEYFKIKKGTTKAQSEEFCTKKSGKTTGLSKVAKYKQSTSCSRTSSILGYYQISRILGISSVPNSVLRTMDTSYHQSVAEKGLRITRADTGSIIYQTWAGLYNLLTGKSSKSRTDLVMTPDRKQSYGALSENPKGEFFYGAPFYYRASYDARMQKFLDNSPALSDIKNSRTLDRIVDNAVTSDNYQRLQQMIDASNLVVLDTLFGQQDRMGNFHFRDYLMYKDADGKLTTDSVRKILKDAEKANPALEAQIDAAKDKSDDNDQRAALITIANDYIKSSTGNSAVTAKKALFKDNDCGLKGSKKWSDSGLIQRMSHVNQTTYDQIMELYRFAIIGSPDSYLSKQLAMNSSERSEFKRNLELVASNMNERCHAGKLHTDLNLKSFFRRESHTTNCGPKLSSIVAAPAKELGPGELMANKVYNVRTAQIFNEPIVDGQRKLTDLSKLGVTSTVGDVLKPVKDHQLNQYTISEAVVVASEGPLKAYIGQTIFISKGVFQ
jgi:hypothetical protein